MRYLLLLILLCLPAMLQAQAPLSLSEALDLARQQNLSLRQQEQMQKLAELEVAIRHGQRLPSLNILGRTSYTSEVAKFDLPTQLTGGRQLQIELGGHDNTTLTLGVLQPLYTGGRLTSQARLAETVRDLEGARRDLLDQRVAYQIHLLFYQAHNLRQEAAIQQASYRRLQTQLDQTRSLFQAAQLMAFDTLRVHNQAMQVQILLDGNARDQQVLLLELARTLDLDAPRPLATLALPPPDAEPLPLDSLQQRALRLRPELQAMRLKLQSAELKKRLAQSAFYPTIEAELGYNIAKPGLNQVANEWMDFARAGINLQWNLWRGNQDRNRVQQANVEREQFSLEEREVLRTVAFEVERSWENMQHARRQVELARRLLAQQQERYRIETIQQQQGLATTNDLLIAEADLTQAELQLERAVIAYYVAEVEMKLATGHIGVAR